MKQSNSSINQNSNTHPSQQIRTAAREYINPVDYDHPYDSMDRFADFLALRYDANRTRHAYYRQIRLLDEYFQFDPATIKPVLNADGLPLPDGSNVN